MEIGLLLLRLTVGLTLEFSRGNEAFYKNNYRRVEIPGVGHFVHGNAPNQIAQLIREGVRTVEFSCLIAKVVTSLPAS